MKKVVITTGSLFTIMVGLLIFTPESWDYQNRTKKVYHADKTLVFRSDYSGFKDATFKYELPDGKIVAKDKMPGQAWDWLDREVGSKEYPRMNGGKLHVHLVSGKNYTFDLPTSSDGIIQISMEARNCEKVNPTIMAWDPYGMNIHPEDADFVTDGGICMERKK